MNFLRDPDLLAYVRSDKRTLVKGGIALLGRTLFAVTVPWLVGRAFDSAIAGVATAEFLAALGWVLAAATATGLCQWWMRSLLVGASRRFEQEARDSLFRRLLALGPGWFARRKTGDLLSRLGSDLEAVRMGAGPAVMYLADTGLRAIAITATMFALSPLLAGWTLLPIVLVFLGLKSSLKKVHDRSLVVQEKQGELSARAQEAFAGARVLKAFGREEDESKRFEAVSERCIEANVRLSRARAVTSGLIECGGDCVVAVIVLVGGAEAVAGRITIGSLVAFLGYVEMLVWPVIAIGWVMSLWQRARASETRLEEIRAGVPEITEPVAPKHPTDPRGVLEVRNLTWTPEGAAKPVLTDVSFRLEAGKRLGIVGRIGSGKSSLLHLVARLENPPPGTVFIDGVDVRDYPVDTLRKTVTLAPQDAFLFSETLRSNIVYGAPNAAPERIKHAVEDAGLSEAVESFPDGLDTLLGERGVTLSGGQRQRTALARAILTEPKLLLIDDGLSAVDADTEERILRSLTVRLAGKTAVIVSHRVSAVADLDHVIVLDGGRVVESGAPRELLAQGGSLAALARLQRDAEALAGGESA